MRVRKVLNHKIETYIYLWIRITTITLSWELFIILRVNNLTKNKQFNLFYSSITNDYVNLKITKRENTEIILIKTVIDQQYPCRRVLNSIVFIF